ncbi:hypothetical protein TCON_2857, partial [Astathelohania contejeani]
EDLLLPEPTNFSISQQWDIEMTRIEAENNSTLSAERMIARGIWRNDEVVIPIGSRVVRLRHTDANRNTRRFALMDHIDTQIYVVYEINERGLLNLVQEDNWDIFLLDIPARDVSLLV